MTIDFDIRPPLRFRAGEARGARIGRVLKAVGRVETVDEDLMALIGRRFMAKDELGASLVRAMRGGEPHRPTMKQFQQALAGGIASVDHAPEALRDFFARVEAVPAWLDRDLLNQGARAYRRYGRNAADVLLQLSLIGGYRFGGPSDLLVATGGLAGDMTMRRLGETQKWGIAVSEHDAMCPGGEGYRLTVHVRLMHAMVNHRFESGGRWEVQRWGLPINQSDLAATLGLFNGALLLGVRALGVRVTPADSRAVMHLWKYVGWLVGVDDDWLFDLEREQHRFNYHVLLAQADVTPAGAQLANAILDAQRTLHFTRFATVGRAWTHARLLSMLRPFLGRPGLRDLGLPVRLPWATLALVPVNLVRYHLWGRTPWGERHLQRRAQRARDTLMFRYFGPDRPDVARLPAV